MIIYELNSFVNFGHFVQNEKGEITAAIVELILHFNECPSAKLNSVPYGDVESLDDMFVLYPYIVQNMSILFKEIPDISKIYTVLDPVLCEPRKLTYEIAVRFHGQPLAGSEIRNNLYDLYLKLFNHVDYAILRSAEDYSDIIRAAYKSMIEKLQEGI